MKILVAVDSSPSSERVLEEAAARLCPAGTSFSIVNVVDVQRFARLPALIEDAKREGDRIVKAGVEKLSPSGHKAVSEVIMGFPRRAVSEYAKEWHADLIMVGSHGHNAIGRFLLGSVAQGILRTAPCSVEVVRPGTDGPPSSHPMKILLATDGSDCSVGAAHSLAKRPWPVGTVIKVLSVEELMVFENQLAASSLSSVYPASLLEELVQDAHDRASSAVEMAKGMLVRAGMNAVSDPSVPIGEPRGVILTVGTVELKDEEQRRLAQLEHEIELLINPTEQDHRELVETIKQIPWRLERGTDELGELNPLMDKATALGQKIFKTEWDRIKNDIEKP
jgi:nucleotide-binding universal stress UspA family protein